MAGAAPQSRVDGDAYVSAGMVYRVATRRDEVDLRALLRGNAMGGWVSLSMEREPDYFTPLLPDDEHLTIICRDRWTNAPVGMCARSVRPAYINGEIRPMGYIGELRVAPGYRNRIRIIRDGFAALRFLAGDRRAMPFYLTSIIADNDRARRLLEAGLPGLPAYRPYADMTTLAMRTGKRPRPAAVGPADASDLPAIAACLGRNGRRQQFAAVWTEDHLRRLQYLGGPGPEDFLVLRRGGDIAGCLALWDQSPVRQTVVRGYDNRIRLLRPLLNLTAPVFGLPPLPDVGEPLSQVFLSHVAVDGDDPEILVSLVAAALRSAHGQGIALALLGLARSNPMFARVSAAFRARGYDNRLYLVHWPEGTAAVDNVDGRQPHVDIALL